MEHAASFRFYDSLNDFLKQEGKNRVIEYHFSGSPSVKDTIEAIGIPHTEVDIIMVNAGFVDFSYALRDKDEVQVHPLTGINHLTSNSLTPAPVYPLKFVADVHAGKLARGLRMLGFDTVYHNHLSDHQLAGLAETEDRVLLTRDLGLLKYRKIKWGYWLRSQQPEVQLAEVIRRFDLADSIHPFARCIHCNGAIAPVDKQAIISKLPQKTIQYFHEFYACSSCAKVYWKGSHYENMVRKITSLISTAAE
jgi:uncharacterized protein with PIN domain